MSVFCIDPHKGDELRELVEKAGCSLPPYSPDFNPIEFVWSWIKNGVRARAPRTDKQRIQDLRELQHELPPQAAKQWFLKCGIN